MTSRETPFNPDILDQILSSSETGLSSGDYVIAVVGPTASGKSMLAQGIAARLSGVVISADSMQVYRELTIGTAKVPEENRLVKHYGIDLVDFGVSYSAAQFQTYARGVIDSCLKQSIAPVVCGGTGLYVRAALDVMDFPQGAQVDNPLRTQFETYLEDHGVDALFSLLRDADPKACELIHPNNTKRVVRALEMAADGKKYSNVAANFSNRQSFYPTKYIGIDVDREELYQRINARVDHMMELGLEDEVRSLIDEGFLDAITASQAIGYKELAEAIMGHATIDEAVKNIKQATRRYAKRQMTWFKADPRIEWIRSSDSNSKIY